MQLTKNWMIKQITDYRQMIAVLGKSEGDKTLYIIWKERINTLESVLKVLELETRVA